MLCHTHCAVTLAACGWGRGSLGQEVTAVLLLSRAPHSPRSPPPTCLLQCFNSPRLEGQPCLADVPEAACANTTATGEPLFCDSLATMRCVRAQTAPPNRVAGEHCYTSRPCAPNLTCDPQNNKCYPWPRLASQPCSNATGETCGDGLSCRPGEGRNPASTKHRR